MFMTSYSREQTDTALAQLASTNLSITGLDAKFLNASDAAKTVGLHENWYALLFKMLSKFAHPQAGLVIGLAARTNTWFAATRATMGTFCARDAIASWRVINLTGVGYGFVGELP